MKGTRPNGQVPFCIYMWNNNYTPFVTVLFLHKNDLGCCFIKKKTGHLADSKCFLLFVFANIDSRTGSIRFSWPYCIMKFQNGSNKLVLEKRD